MKSRLYFVISILILIFAFSSCAFIDGLTDELFDTEGSPFIIEKNLNINITITPFNGSDYPGSSDSITIDANSAPVINWKVEGANDYDQYWIFIYSPLLYSEGRTAAVYPDVWVVTEISPTVNSTVFGEVPPGVFGPEADEWDNPVLQPLKYNGTYTIWVATELSTAGGWNGLGMAEVIVKNGIDPPESPDPDLSVSIDAVDVFDTGNGDYEVKIYYTVYNNSEFDAEYFEVGVWGDRSKQPSAGEYDYYTTVYYSYLPGNDFIKGSVSVFMYQSFATAYVFADIWDYIRETDEFNNSSSGWSWTTPS